MPASKAMQVAASENKAFRPIVYELISQLCALLNAIDDEGADLPSLAVGARSQVWSARETQLSGSRDSVLELSKNLCQQLQGPHEYFHDLISHNWDLGALYAIIEFGILEKIPLNGQASASELAGLVGLDERKLLNILRLATCSNVLHETESGVFIHTALSEELLQDEKFRAFIGFQLFETRIASTNLADSLKKGTNTFDDGQSAFKYAMGAPLYQWHATHQEKGQRFRMAMESVTKTLDPGDDLFRQWFEEQVQPENIVVDVFGGNKVSQAMFAKQFPQLSFESAAAVDDISGHNGPVLAYTIRNVFWNKTDKEVVSVVAKISESLAQHPGATLLINEMLSPSNGEFHGELEHAYRRRDVTTMTMHNAKQRTKAEWITLFNKVRPQWQTHIIADPAQNRAFIPQLQGPMVTSIDLISDSVVW